MKTTITLREGRFVIEMKPENDFEKTLIEDAEQESNKFKIHTDFSTSSMQTNHTITITGIKEEK